MSEAAGFVRSLDPSLFPSDRFPPETSPEDVTSSDTAPDIEIFASMVAYKDHGGKLAPNFGHYNFSLHTVALRPKSTGTIRLKSANPEDAPLIDPQYATSPQNA